VRLYSDDAKVWRITRALIAQGQRVLQTHFLAVGERAHVGALLDFFAPPENATVLDLGCGVGRVAEIMQELRPDLSFILLNQSAAQLSLCPSQFRRVRGSYEKLPDGLIIDAAMAQYVIGHGDIDALMREVAKVLPKDGVLCIYDLVADVPTPALHAVLDYHGYTASEVQSAAAAAGLTSDRQQVPPITYTEHFQPHLPADVFNAIFTAVHPMLFRFIKC